MKLRFDPAEPDFLEALQHIPGYPPGETVPIRAMVFESNAVARLPNLLTLAGAKSTAPLFIVVDELRIRRGADELKPFVRRLLEEAGWQVETIVLVPPAGAALHTDIEQVERVKSALTRDAAVLALGSGTVTDVAKHACFLFEQETGVHVPLVVMTTANSVSAYTSNTASVEVGGVKKTLPSRYLDVLVCDLETLSSAPKAANVAGIGDLLVAFGCFADWFLAYRVGLDHNYSELPRTLIGPLDEIFFENVADIRDATLDGSRILAKLLALEGLATSLAHTTAPFSGFEHLISHLLDLLAKHYRLPPTLHGTQVVLLTILTTLAFREFMEEFDPRRVELDACYPSPTEMRERIDRAFAPLDPSGAIAGECWREYSKKLEAWHAQRATFGQFLSEWDDVRAQLQTLVRPPELLVEILQRMGSPTHFDQLNPPTAEEHLRFAFFNAPFIRNRFTLGDLFIFLNWDVERLWTQVWRASRALVSVQIPG